MRITKADVLAAIEAERAAWEALVAEVGPERMEQPGFAGDWTFKDVAAHLNGWRRRTFDRLEAATFAQPEPPPPWPAELDTDDAINAWLHERDRDRPLSKVLEEASFGFTRLRDAVAQLPDAALTEPDYFPWMGGTALGQSIVDRSFFAHLHQEHEPDIRKRLAQR